MRISLVVVKGQKFMAPSENQTYNCLLIQLANNYTMPSAQKLDLVEIEI